MLAIEKFRAAVAAIGAWNAILFALARACTVLFGNRVRIVKYYFVVQPLLQSSPGSRTPSGKFALDWAGPDSPLFAQVERPLHVIAARFAQGARCLTATIDGTRLAGFMWFVVGSYDEDEVRARFVPRPDGRSAWDFDVTIQPDFRMGRLFSYLWARASAELAALGVTQTISRISAFNAASLAAHRRLGARMVGEALFFGVGRCQLMRSTAKPRWHFSWRDDQAPVMEIGP